MNPAFCELIFGLSINQANEFKEALHANAIAGREALTLELEAKHAEAVSASRYM